MCPYNYEYLLYQTKIKKIRKWKYTTSYSPISQNEILNQKYSRTKHTHNVDVKQNKNIEHQ